MWCYPEIRSLADLPRYHVRHGRAAQTAMSFEGRSLSYDQFDRLSNRIANALARTKMPVNSRIGFLGKNSDSYWCFFFGGLKAGHTFVPLNYRLAPMELRDIIEDADIQLLISDIDFQDLIGKITPMLKPTIESVFIAPQSRHQLELDKWLGPAEDTRPAVEINGDDVAVLLYTSGTTGTPKGVEFSFSGYNYMQLLVELEPALDFTEKDILLAVAPTFHMLGINFCLNIFYSGGTLRILREVDIPKLLECINNDRPSLLVLPPVIIQMMLDHPDFGKTDFSSLRALIYAGSSISIQLLRKALTVMQCNFVQLYGTTESGGCISLLRPEDHDLEDENKLKSCGRPMPLTEIKVMDPDGNEVAIGEKGELWLRIPSLFKKYRHKPALTEQVVRDGWNLTGDIGRQDADGFYYIVDRAKDMIISGGENIYAAEVEQVICEHPAVKEAAVIGVPDNRWGEAVKAVVIVRDGYQLSADELITHCRGYIGGYKVPKSVTFVDSFPVSATGKLLKRKLREVYSRHRRPSVD